MTIAHLAFELGASAGFQGTASDIEVQACEIIRMNARLQEMMAADTGQSVERVVHDSGGRSGRGGCQGDEHDISKPLNGKR